MGEKYKKTQDELEELRAKNKEMEEKYKKTRDEFEELRAKNGEMGEKDKKLSEFEGESTKEDSKDSEEKTDQKYVQGDYTMHESDLLKFEAPSPKHVMLATGIVSSSSDDNNDSPNFPLSSRSLDSVNKSVSSFRSAMSSIDEETPRPLAKLVSALS